MRGVARDVFLAATALVGAAGYFLSSTVLMERVPDVVIVMVTTVGALLVSVAMSGVSRPWSALTTARQGASRALFAGALSFAIAPLIVLSQRASDAPSGTEVLLFTTSSWGFLVCVIAVLLSRPPRSWGVLAASLSCGIGGLSVLANWERPSSLSPFVRFPAQHGSMLLAGLVFAVGAFVLARSVRALGPSVTAALASLGASIVAVSAVLLGGVVDVAPLAGAMNELVFLAVFGALFTIGWVRASAQAGLAWTSVSLSLVPVAITGLSFVERALSVYGPNPIRWRPAGAGIAIALAAAFALWNQRETATRPRGPESALPRPAVVRGMLAAGTLSVTLACVAMFTGGLEADIAGAFSEEYRATWTMLGIETAVGWLALAGAGCALAAAVDASRGFRRSAWVSAALALLVPATYPLLADTPVRTATRWVPADVQQTLGTEYARISFEAMVDPVRLASIVLSGAVGVVVIVHLLRTRQLAPSSEGVT